MDIASVHVGSAAAAAGTIDEIIEPHDVEEGPPLSLHYLKLVDALGVLQRNRAKSSASVQGQQESDEGSVRPMPTPSSFRHCSIAQSFDDLSKEASLEQCRENLRLILRHKICTLRIARVNAFDRTRPVDAKLLDSGAEINIENDLRKFVSRITETDLKINFADGSQTLAVEGFGLVREWYYDRSGRVVVDTYKAYYCPGAEFPIRSEQEMRLAGWQVVRLSKTPGQVKGVDVVRELPNGEEEVLKIPRLIKDKKSKSKRMIRDPEHAALTHLITPAGDVLLAQQCAVGTLEWMKPIQADSHNGTRPSAVSNAHASVTRDDASYAEVQASLKSVRKKKKRAKAALLAADIIANHDTEIKATTSVNAIPRPGKALFSDDPSMLPLITKDLHACMSAYLRARVARHGYRTEEVTLAMNSMQSSFDALREYDANDARQTYDATEDQGLHYDHDLKCVQVCPRCRRPDHTHSDCLEPCWSCMLDVGHSDECEVALLHQETIAIPATEAVAVRTDQKQAELDHENRINAMFAAVSVSSTNGTTNWRRQLKRQSHAVDGDDSEQSAEQSVSVMPLSDEVLHCASILKLNDEDDMQNLHMLEDSDRITLEAFMKQYSSLGTPSYADSVISNTEALAVGQKSAAGPSGGVRAPAASGVQLASVSASASPARPSALKQATEGTGANPRRATERLMAHCSVCSALCPELDVPYTFVCDGCDTWFERPYLAKAVNQISSSDGDRVKQVRKRAQESRMITAEDVSIKRKNLVRNLTPHVHANKDLALPSLNGMPSGEWWYFLNGNEQLSLCMRGKMYTLAKKASELTFKEYRTDTKVEWRKKRWEASVRVLKRARREWEETVAQIVRSLERTFDPGASQGTYKRAAVDRSVKKHQTTDDRTHA